VLRIGFYQFRPRFGEVSANLDQIEAALRGIRADLVVLPELATTGYNFVSAEELAGLAEPVPEGPTVERLAVIARRENTHLVVGIAERAGQAAPGAGPGTPAAGPTAVYNSAVLISPRGFSGLYRKVHLYSREKTLFAPGDLGFPLFTLDAPGSPRVGLLVCFDWRFPESARTLALAGADILAHPANLVEAWCQAAMVTRCLENRVFAVTANRTGCEDRGGLAIPFTGQSQVLDPGGRVLAAADAEEERLSIVTVDLEAARKKSINPWNDVLEDRRPGQYRSGQA
jgi:predicted amidohydrolase